MFDTVQLLFVASCSPVLVELAYISQKAACCTSVYVEETVRELITESKLVSFDQNTKYFLQSHVTFEKRLISNYKKLFCSSAVECCILGLSVSSAGKRRRVSVRGRCSSGVSGWSFPQSLFMILCLSFSSDEVKPFFFPSPASSKFVHRNAHSRSVCWRLGSRGAGTGTNLSSDTFI